MVAAQHVRVPDPRRRPHLRQAPPVLADPHVGCVADRQVARAHVGDLELELARLPPVVAVEEGDVAAAGRLDAGIAGGGDATVAGLRQRADARVVGGHAAQHFQRAVARAVVDRQQFPVRPALRANAADRTREPGLRVVDRHDDADQRVGVAHGRGRTPAACTGRARRAPATSRARRCTACRPRCRCPFTCPAPVAASVRCRRESGPRICDGGHDPWSRRSSRNGSAHPPARKLPDAGADRSACASLRAGRRAWSARPPTAGAPGLPRVGVPPPAVDFRWLTRDVQAPGYSVADRGREIRCFTGRRRSARPVARTPPHVFRSTP